MAYDNNSTHKEEKISIPNVPALVRERELTQNQKLLAQGRCPRCRTRMISPDGWEFCPRCLQDEEDYYLLGGVDE